MREIKLYRGVISHMLDDVVLEFEANNDSEAQAIVDTRAQSILVPIISKKLYIIGTRIK